MPTRGFRRALGPIFLGVLAVAGGGCEERDRLTFPVPPDGEGPVVFIDRPATADTTVPEGPGVPVRGRVIDPDGVDTVYFVTTNVAFPPAIGEDDELTFELPIPTERRAGDTLRVLIFATDELGNRGDTAFRRIIVAP